MPRTNLMDLFPNLQKKKRVSRGQKFVLGWCRINPNIEELAKKAMLGTIFNYSILEENSGGRIRNIHRILIKSSDGRFGYICFKPENFDTTRCRSYNELFSVISNLESNIRWYASFPSLVRERVARCSNAIYKDNLSIMVAPLQ